MAEPRINFVMRALVIGNGLEIVSVAKEGSRLGIMLRGGRRRMCQLAPRASRRLLEVAGTFTDRCLRARRGAEARSAVPVRLRFFALQHGASVEGTVLTEKALCFRRNH